MFTDLNDHNDANENFNIDQGYCYVHIAKWLNIQSAPIDGLAFIF